MAQNFQSSFIPNAPKGQSSVTSHLKKEKTSVTGIIVITLFALVLLATIGSFVYKFMLKSDIENIKANLAAAESSIDKETIAEMIQFSDKLRATRSIINKHQAISTMTKILEENVVSSVYFTGFNYNNLSSEGFSISVDGKADGYAAVAFQEQTLREHSDIVAIDTSDMSLNSAGQVSFTFIITVDSQALVYQTEEDSQSIEADSQATVDDEFDDLEDLEADLDLSELDQLEKEISNL